jgi:hypothetical protein
MQRSPAKLPASTHKQLNMYTLAATAAGLGVLGLSQPAEAKIVYTPANVVIPKDTNIVRYIDLNHDGIWDFELHHAFDQSSRFTLSSLNVFGPNGGSNVVMGGKQQHSPFTSAFALKAGAKIGRGAGFSQNHSMMAFATSPGSSVVWGYWAANREGFKNRYLGLQFVIKGKRHYGWARLTVTVQQQREGHSIAAILTGYAYETIPGKSIKAGQTKEAADDTANGPGANLAIPDIPKPATLGALALGAPGLSIWRREQSVSASQ